MSSHLAQMHDSVIDKRMHNKRETHLRMKESGVPVCGDHVPQNYALLPANTAMQTECELRRCPIAQRLTVLTPG